MRLLALTGLLLTSSLPFASSETTTMTCAQVQDYVKRDRQTLLTTGKEFGNYSFDYAHCGGTAWLRLYS